MYTILTKTLKIQQWGNWPKKHMETCFPFIRHWGNGTLSHDVIPARQAKTEAGQCQLSTTANGMWTGDSCYGVSSLESWRHTHTLWPDSSGRHTTQGDPVQAPWKVGVRLSTAACWRQPQTPATVACDRKPWCTLPAEYCSATQLNHLWLQQLGSIRWIRCCKGKAN